MMSKSCGHDFWVWHTKIPEAPIILCLNYIMLPAACKIVIWTFFKTLNVTITIKLWVICISQNNLGIFCPTNFGHILPKNWGTICPWAKIAQLGQILPNPYPKYGWANFAQIFMKLYRNNYNHYDIAAYSKTLIMVFLTAIGQLSSTTPLNLKFRIYNF